jgi:ElaB/YqjD/DUF883 family membrane-anchored ribosome-binding protein
VTQYGDRMPGRESGSVPPDTRTSRTGEPEIDEIVTEIEQTRGEMTVTVEAIGERLDPGNIAANAKQTVRDATVGKVEQMASQAGDVIEDAGRTAQETGAGVVETIRQNPVPAALVGLGLGWLWMNRSTGDGGRRSGYGASGYGGRPWPRYEQTRPGRYEQQGWYEPQGRYEPQDRYQAHQQSGGMMGGAAQAADRFQQAGGDAAHQAGEIAGQVQQAAGEAVEQVQQTAEQVAWQAQEFAGQAGYQAQSLARDIQYNAQRMMHESPLAVGAIAVAVGAAIGAALPATRREQEMIGPMSRDLMQQADQVVRQAESTAEEQLRDMEQQAKESE